MVQTPKMFILDQRSITLEKLRPGIFSFFLHFCLNDDLLQKLRFLLIVQIDWMITIIIEAL